MTTRWVRDESLASIAIPSELTYEGSDKEFQFRDKFVMPFLVQLGFRIVLNYHGQRELGRDVIFGDVDRFGHVVYYGMQIRYESSISLSDSHSLVQDAEQAAHNPFSILRPAKRSSSPPSMLQTQAVFQTKRGINFLSTLKRKGVRDVRLLDGNALAVLNWAAAFESDDVVERLTGMLQEVRRNQRLIAQLVKDLTAYIRDQENALYPGLRLRNIAAGAYLSAPFPVPGLASNNVDRYWELMRVLNKMADDVGIAVAAKGFREGRCKSFENTAHEAWELGRLVETAVVACLTDLGTTPS